MVDRPVTRGESLERVASDIVAGALFFGADIVLFHDRQDAVKNRPSARYRPPRFLYISSKRLTSRVNSVPHTC